MVAGMRALFRWLFSGSFLAAVVASIIGGIILHVFLPLAEERGWLDGAAEWLVAAMIGFAEFVTQPLFLGFLLFVGGAAFGTWLDFFLRTREREAQLRNAGFKISSLADEADRLSTDLYELIDNFEPKPPAHPDYVSIQNIEHSDWRETNDRWWRQQYEQKTKLISQFRLKYAPDVWRVIAMSRHYVEIPLDAETIFEKQSDSIDVENIAKILSYIAGRLRLVEAGEKPFSTTALTIKDV